jgi:hypothetical protein
VGGWHDFFFSESHGFHDEFMGFINSTPDLKSSCRNHSFLSSDFVVCYSLFAPTALAFIRAPLFTYIKKSSARLHQTRRRVSNLSAQGKSSRAKTGAEPLTLRVARWVALV